MTAGLVPWMIKLRDEGPNVMRNACLESFLTHTRLLIEFLCGRPIPNELERRKRNSRDVTPRDLGLGSWCSQPATQFDGYLVRIDQFLAHLTNSRIDNPAAQQWPVERITVTLFAAFGTLADDLDRRGSNGLASVLRLSVAESIRLLASPPEDWPKSILGA
jgi:hypothetical protein